MATAFPIDGLIIDRSITTNLHRQLYSQLRGLIERRVLPSGTALPSTRLLTKDLGVGRNTVIAAYEQLALEGYLQMRRGSPPLVMDLPTTRKCSKEAAYRNRQHHIGARKNHAGATPSPWQPGPSCLSSRPAGFRQFSLHHLVEAAQQEEQSSPAMIFSAPITSVAIRPCAKPSPAISPRRAG